MEYVMKEVIGCIAAISISEKKGVQKSNIHTAVLREQWGIVGDAHAGDWHRQVSLLASESIDKIRQRGLDVTAGAFAENITTSGVDLVSLSPGDRIFLGQVELEVTQIGKECHTRCAIYYQAGDCVMPREGIFARVLRGGSIRVGDSVRTCRVTDKSPRQAMTPLDTALSHA
jgi:MOSC domain-containing protein YiiM